MTARRIVCPRCKTTLQLPASMGAGKVKCPKCATVLSVSAPAKPAPASPAAARAAAAPASRPPAQPADPFGGLPDFGNLPSGGGQGYHLPPAAGPPGFSAPAAPASFPSPSFQAPPRPLAPAQPKRKSGGGGKTALKVIGIIGALGMTCVLLCAGAIFAIGYAGSRHSGWTSESFQGYTIQMPAGTERKRRSEQQPFTTIHELIAQRRETGSQYSLTVASLPDAARLNRLNITVEQLLEKGTIRFTDQRPVTRSGVQGVAGTILSGAGVTPGAECESFLHNGKMIVVTYAPYSKIKDSVGGTRKPRTNERELDKPEEFFESLKL